MLENVKKCKNFLATLIKLASGSGPQATEMGQNVKNLVQNLLVRLFIFKSKVWHLYIDFNVEFIILFLLFLLVFVCCFLNSSRVVVEYSRSSKVLHYDVHFNWIPYCNFPSRSYFILCTQVTVRTGRVYCFYVVFGSELFYISVVLSSQ